MDFNICQLNCQDTIDSKIIGRLGLNRLPKPPLQTVDPWHLGGDAEVLIRADFYKLGRLRLLEAPNQTVYSYIGVKSGVL